MYKATSTCIKLKRRWVKSLVDNPAIWADFPWSHVHFVRLSMRRWIEMRIPACRSFLIIKVVHLSDFFLWRVVIEHLFWLLFSFDHWLDFVKDILVDVGQSTSLLFALSLVGILHHVVLGLLQQVLGIHLAEDGWHASTRLTVAFETLHLLVVQGWVLRYIQVIIDESGPSRLFLRSYLLLCVFWVQNGINSKERAILLTLHGGCARDSLECRLGCLSSIDWLRLWSTFAHSSKLCLELLKL